MEKILKKKTTTKKTEKPKMGRPSKYDEKMHPKLVYEMAGNGKTDRYIAKSFEIDTATLWRWMKDYPDFCKAYYQGWDDYYSPKVEKSLARRATGYEVIETVEEIDGDKTKQKTIKRHIPGDTQAIKYYLNNRKSDRWKEKSELGLTADGINIVIDPSFLANGNKKDISKP